MVLLNAPNTIFQSVVLFVDSMIVYLFQHVTFPDVIVYIRLYIESQFKVLQIYIIMVRISHIMHLI